MGSDVRQKLQDLTTDSLARFERDELRIMLKFWNWETERMVMLLTEIGKFGRRVGVGGKAV